MTYEEMEAILGPPLCVVAVEDPIMSEAEAAMARELIDDCGLWGTTRPLPPPLRRAADVKLSYAEPRLQLVGLEIYVYLKAGRVNDVYVNAMPSPSSWA